MDEKQRSEDRADAAIEKHEDREDNRAGMQCLAHSGLVSDISNINSTLSKVEISIKDGFDKSSKESKSISNRIWGIIVSVIFFLLSVISTFLFTYVKAGK